MHARSPLNVCVIDYGMGNLRSVFNKVAAMCEHPVLSSDPADILAADMLILPGVGQFAQGMKNLDKSGLRAAMERKVLEDKVPILGICLGMQLFTQHSEEGDTAGLAWVEANTRKFDASKVDNPYFRIPHMGWNTLEVNSKNPIYRDLTPKDELYFCHSYYVDCAEKSAIASHCSYGIRFCASIEKGNIHGMQFHPEKSHDQGAKLIENFIKIGVAEKH